MPITRDHLYEPVYEPVWAKPMLTVAKEYEVSANCLGWVSRSPIVSEPQRAWRTWAATAHGRQLPPDTFEVDCARWPLPAEAVLERHYLAGGWILSLSALFSSLCIATLLPSLAPRSAAVACESRILWARSSAAALAAGHFDHA